MIQHFLQFVTAVLLVAIFWELCKITVSSKGASRKSQNEGKLMTPIKVARHRRPADPVV